MSLRDVLHDIVDRIPWADEATRLKLHDSIGNATDLDNTRRSDDETQAEETDSGIPPGPVQSSTLFQRPNGGNGDQ